MAKPITRRQWEVFENRRLRGWSVAQSALEARVSLSAAYHREKAGLASALPRESRRWMRLNGELGAQGPLAGDDLRPEAQRALEDFGYFQRRYFGRIATPWQEEAAERLRVLLESPVKEFVVMNGPPGGGKSTLFTLDIPAWLTCRNRRIRGLIGSRTGKLATRYVQRLRRHLELTVPWRNEGELVDRGLAADAEATLCDDFGLFRPLDKDLWSGDAFVVAQLHGSLIAEKEPSWSAFGMDTGLLGMRYDFIVWDDLVDDRIMRSAEARANQQSWWDDVAEKRLEPAGVLCLQGQRLGPDDLYRYCLNKKLAPDDDGMVPAKYHHVVFKAHYPDRCTGDHEDIRAGYVPPYYPQGCLLDPLRLPWRELRAEMSNPRRMFEVLYQQEDVDPAAVLVDPAWVYGGSDERTGELLPGCVDRERQACELPRGLAGDLLSVVTVDPSPARLWSVQWWVVRCADGTAQERYLMDHLHVKMDASAFLDWHESTRHYSGVAEEWQVRSKVLGQPIGWWVVEANAAQKFMLQFEHMKRWLAHHRVSLIPHTTYQNKADPDYGVEATLKSIYRHGLVRLPMKTGSGYLASIKLIDEVTHWPGWKSDDCVMAQWFLEWHLPRLVPVGKLLPRAHRPSWLRNTSTWAALGRKEVVGVGA